MDDARKAVAQMVKFAHGVPTGMQWCIRGYAARRIRLNDVIPITFMLIALLLYLDVSYGRWQRDGKMKTVADLEGAVMEGAVQRVRPKMMTVFAFLLGLLPIMWSSGAGSDVMKRIAAPMVGGIVTSSILELLIYPAISVLRQWWAEVRHFHATP